MKLRLAVFISRLAHWGRAASLHQASLWAWKAALKLTGAIMVLQAVLYGLLYAAGFLPLYRAELLAICFLATLGSSLIVGYLVCYSAGIHIMELNESKAQLREMTRVDALSGLLNRRAFLEMFDERPAGASLAVFDVDRFKSINDRFGHGAGDRVIVAVARLLQEVYSAHAQNRVARLGGEEFAVLSCGADIDSDASLAELLRMRVETARFDYEGQSFLVTISGGLVEAAPAASFSDCFALADKALYRAKQRGRNRIERALVEV